MNEDLKKEARLLMEYAVSDSDREAVFNQLDMAIDRATEAERKNSQEKLAHLENFYKKFAEQRYREGVADSASWDLTQQNK